MAARKGLPDVERRSVPKPRSRHRGLAEVLGRTVSRVCRFRTLANVDGHKQKLTVVVVEVELAQHFPLLAPNLVLSQARQARDIHEVTCVDKDAFQVVYARNVHD